jgi:hypothetical protein
MEMCDSSSGKSNRIEKDKCISAYVPRSKCEADLRLTIVVLAVVVLPFIKAVRVISIRALIVLVHRAVVVAVAVDVRVRVLGSGVGVRVILGLVIRAVVVMVMVVPARGILVGYIIFVALKYIAGVNTQRLVRGRVRC